MKNSACKQLGTIDASSYGAISDLVSDIKDSSNTDVSEEEDKEGILEDGDSKPTRSSPWKATVNLMKFMEGVGFLTLPFAVAKGGILVIAALMAMPIMNWYTSTILVDCLYDIDTVLGRVRKRSTLLEIGDVLWPRYGGVFVAVMQNLDLAKISVSYLILCGSVMTLALPSVPMSQASWTCLAAMVALPTTFLKSISRVAWLSAVGVLAITSTALAVFCYGALNISKWDIATVLHCDLEGLLVSLGIVFLTYSSYAIVLSVEESMAERHKFNKTLGCAYSIMAPFKICFGMVGFLSFSFGTDDIVVNNLPAGPIRTGISSLFVFGCLWSYALPLHPVFRYLEDSSTFDWISSKLQFQSICFIALRVTVVLITLLCAAFVHNFALFTSLMGFVFMPFGNYILPCLTHIKLRWEVLKLHQVILNISLVIFGLLMMIFGVTVSIKALVVESFHR